MNASVSSRIKGPDARAKLAYAIGDRPETTIPIHALNSGYGRAFVSGEPEAPESAVIEWVGLPGELFGFGEAESLWALLREVRGWSCVLVESSRAKGISQLMRVGMGKEIRTFQDVNYLLEKRVAEVHHPEVARLSLEDPDSLQEARRLVRMPKDFPELVLREAPVWGARVENRLVSLSVSLARSVKYADITIATDEPYRSRGLATAEASGVAHELQGRGLTPVWSTAEDNPPSRRVAEKLGFTECHRLTYVVPID